MIVSPTGDSTTATDTLNLDDVAGPASRTVGINAGTPAGTWPGTISGMLGSTGNLSNITYNGSKRIQTVNILGGTAGNTFNVSSTYAGTAYNVQTGTGNDTVNISNSAPALLNPSTNPIPSTLANIQGPINLDTQGGADVLNLSDYGSGTSQTYGLTKVGNTTVLTATGVANITYDYQAALPPPFIASHLESFNLIGRQSRREHLQRQYHHRHRQQHDHRWRRHRSRLLGVQYPGRSVASRRDEHVQRQRRRQYVQPELQLQRHHRRRRPTLAVNGGAGTSANRNVVNVNVTARHGGTGPGLYVPRGHGRPGQRQRPGHHRRPSTQAQEVNFFGPTTGLTSNMDTATVTGPGGGTVLSATPTSANAADVFLGGTPRSRLPRRASISRAQQGGGSAPDLFLTGLVQATGLQVNGGATGNNQLVVNATTEDSGGLAATSGWGGSGMTIGSTPEFGDIHPAVQDLDDPHGGQCLRHDRRRRRGNHHQQQCDRRRCCRRISPAVLPTPARRFRPSSSTPGTRSASRPLAPTPESPTTSP